MTLIGVAACNTYIDAPHHAVYERYVDGLATTFGWTPLLIPAFQERFTSWVTQWAETIVARIDGLLLPGSPSNVGPQAYGLDRARRTGETFDTQRDATTLELIRCATRHGLPVLGICRGMQEINVAFGGTLRFVDEPIDGSERSEMTVNHRAPVVTVREGKYLPSHQIDIPADGQFRCYCDLSGSGWRAHVNSLHVQCIHRLADGFTVEAHSEDGIIEAIRLDQVGRFCVGVQWHPEWQYEDEPLSRALFEQFARSAKEVKLARCGGGHV